MLNRTNVCFMHFTSNMAKASGLIILFILSLSSCCEICPSHEGKDFLVVFLQNFINNDDSDRLSIDITSSFTTTVYCFTTYENCVGCFNESFKVKKSEVTKIDVPLDFELLDNEVSNKSIRIISDHNIIVYAVNKRLYSGDIYLVYPTDRLGTNYVVATHENELQVTKYLPVLAVSALEDDTVVEFTFQTQISFSFSNDTRYTNVKNIFTVHLKQFEVIQISHTELNGAIIQANKHIIAVSGNTFLKLKDDVNGTTGDFISEQLLPVKYWSTEYVLVPSSNDLDINEIVRIYNIENDAKLTIDQGGRIINYHLVGPGKSYDLLLNKSAILLTSNKKVMVVQIGIPRADLNGDPYMFVTSAVSTFVTYSMFLIPHTHNTNDFQSRLILIANAESFDSIILDDVRLDPSVWETVGPYFFARISVDKGAHTVLTTQRGGLIGGYIHGRRRSFGYASSIGGYLDDAIICQDLKTVSSERFVSDSSVVSRYDKTKRGTKPSIDPFLLSGVYSLTECGRKCRDHEDCTYFAFEENISVCSLFNMNAVCSLTDGYPDTILYRKIL